RVAVERAVHPEDATARRPGAARAADRGRGAPIALFATARTWLGAREEEPPERPVGIADPEAQALGEGHRPDRERAVGDPVLDVQQVDAALLGRAFSHGHQTGE